MLLWLPRPAHGQQLLPAQDRQTDAATINDRLRSELQQANGPVSFLAILDEQIDVQAVAALAATTHDAAADSHNAAADPKALSIRRALYANLTETARATQAPLRAWLEANHVPYRAFYIVNMLEVRGDLGVAEALAARPEVAYLIANLPVQASLDSGAMLVSRGAPHGWRVVAADQAESSAALPWGLAASGAPDLWTLGYSGQGVVVASQDTGVDWQHPALQAQYRGWNEATNTASHPYNWFDAFGLDDSGPCGAARGSAQIPCDDWGHGTHTVGTMLGDATGEGQTILGMAPDATWIGCRNMRDGIGSPASYAACFEFFLAPYPQNGDPMTDGQPEQAPDIINNSWGCPPSEDCTADVIDILRPAVETARAAGQYVAVSAGNEGPDCSTVMNPAGIYEASFSVGAFAQGGAIAGFSSRGPVTIDGSGRIKPDISAPGVSVYSTLPNSDYGTSSGTSMASPHVAGAVALLWSAVPSLKGEIDLTEAILEHSATPVITSTCMGPGYTSLPSAVYGHGRLNALAAVNLALNPPTVRVRTTDGDGHPLLNTSAYLMVQEPWEPAPRRVTLDATGEVLLPVYTLEWNGERSTPIVLSRGTNSSGQLTDSNERELLSVHLYTPTVHLPLIRN